MPRRPSVYETLSQSVAVRNAAQRLSRPIPNQDALDQAQYQWEASYQTVADPIVGPPADTVPYTWESATDADLLGPAGQAGPGHPLFRSRTCNCRLCVADRAPMGLTGRRQEYRTWAMDMGSSVVGRESMPSLVPADDPAMTAEAVAKRAERAARKSGPEMDPFAGQSGYRSYIIDRVNQLSSAGIISYMVKTTVLSLALRAVKNGVPWRQFYDLHLRDPYESMDLWSATQERRTYREDIGLEPITVDGQPVEVRPRLRSRRTAVLSPESIAYGNAQDLDDLHRDRRLAAEDDARWFLAIQAASMPYVPNVLGTQAPTTPQAPAPRPVTTPRPATVQGAVETIRAVYSDARRIF